MEQVIAENVVPVLDHGFVALDAALASDLAVVNGARVSFNQESRRVHRARGGPDPVSRCASGTGARSSTGTSASSSRRRSSSSASTTGTGPGTAYNEWSGRYSKMEPEFYVPDYVRTQVGKPGAYTFEPVDDETRELVRHEIEENAQRAFDAYERMLEQGVAKEVARAVLPLSTYTKYYWSCNPRSLMHFCGLRNHESAQYEIRQFAAAAETFLEQLMPVTHAAFVANGRRSP